MGTIVRLKPHGALRREATALRTSPPYGPGWSPPSSRGFRVPAAGAGLPETVRLFDATVHQLPHQARWRVARAVVQSVTMACCAAARVTWPLQTAVCSFVSTGSFLLLTPEPVRWPGSAGSTHKLR